VTAHEDFLAELHRSLELLTAGGLRRSLTLPRGIDLVSNDYLGLARHPAILERMRTALEETGVGSGGSRLLRGHERWFEQLEERLAAFCGTESALLFSSGYAANVGMLQALLSPNDLVLSDEHNHASLIDGLRLSGARKIIYRHQDVTQVEQVLRAPRPRRTFIVTESLFSMDGDLSPLRKLADVALRHDALLIVDEAHATGLYGARGSGCIEEAGIREAVLASVHTGGKALGAGGAWIAGPMVIRDTLIHRARSFVFSTAPLPVLTAALDAALDLIAREPHRRADVQRKSVLLRTALHERGIDVPGDLSPIVPVVVGANEAAVALQQGLAAAGFDARAVRPPTVPVGTARLRVTVREPVADEDLRRFAEEAARILGMTR
jgi:8-amino-7-oxononanoate synthase